MDTPITSSLLMLVALFGAAAQAQTAPQAQSPERMHPGHMVLKPYGSGYEARGLGDAHIEQLSTPSASVGTPQTTSVAKPAEQTQARQRGAQGLVGGAGSGGGSSGGSGGGSAGGGRR